VPTSNTITSPPRRVHRYSIWQALCAQGAVIYGLMVHDITSHFKKSRLGYLWELFDPLMQILLWFALFVFIRGPRTIYDMNTFLFLGTGIIGLFFFQKIGRELPSALRRYSGLMRLPIVRQIDALLAGGLSEAVVMTLVAAILWSAIILGGFGFAPANLLGVIAACASLGALGIGFGWFNSMALVFVPVYSKFLPIIFRILFFTSGAIFPLERIPPSIFKYLQWNPVYQGVDLVRSAWSFTYTTTTSSSDYVLAWAAGFLLLGLLLDKHAQRARARG
jgi:capsular polysaccharide transport system permease protein